MVTSVLEPQDLDPSPAADRNRPLSMAALTLLNEPIRLELRRQLHIAMNPARMRPALDRPRAAILRQAFVHLFGADRRASEYRYFVLVAAPLIRELLLREVGGPIHASGLNTAALDISLGQLERIAPRQARMIDLLYFAGVGVKEAGELLGVTEWALRRELRFVKAWLASARRHDVTHNDNASTSLRR
jgi:hypothetical protein